MWSLQWKIGRGPVPRRRWSLCASTHLGRSTGEASTGGLHGSTESFLYPVLDHAARARAEGQRGTKALLLYPMNALANDQADRLAKLLTSEPALAGVTAGIYTGESKGSVRKVTRDSLITDRDQMRADPPDILLTNYKMLDQLLLREEDREIWKRSATSLQYLVLDEFPRTTMRRGREAYARFEGMG
ncbi:DEAD/DEAH box helicase [Corynebacterium sp. MSK008]|uniref:DEAD/DEAH box helicase n=1 Tax=Corynebacterium sp. MSK008 TaxID=3050188 RepID=UPI00254A1ED4|nr:DEAD/DEAH box helicase [Corynebacterium sp. MSK008]MDK8878711.1 DEAD/DEAH box helicase [Corynebacterium sp. MSK008]